MKKEELTFRQNLISAISVINNLLKADTFDYTKKHGSIFIGVAKDYLDNAEKMI